MPGSGGRSPSRCSPPDAAAGCRTRRPRVSVHSIDPFGLASDLGDLDGDGYLDWVTSSYSGDWRLFENRGGTVVVGRELAPRTASSCALLFDADGDGDLDMGLIDEEADEVIVVHNGG